MDGHCLKVGQLQKFLEPYPPSLRVILASDAEGNCFHPCEEIQEEALGKSKVLILWPRHEQVYID